MDRNREPRRATPAMTPSNNGLSRRRQRSNSLRDSPEEDLAVEMHEVGRLRDRTVKKDRDRDRTVRSKKRRIDEESSEGSVNDEADEEEEEGTVRMLPPNPAVTGHGHSQQQMHQQHVAGHVSRSSKGFVGIGNNNSNNNNNKMFKPVQGWKPADEMIGFSVPRKARSVSKRSHENWVSGAGATPEHILRQASPSPSPSTAPLSPSSSNVSVRKKMKTKGSKQKPPKSSSKASSSNPEELEIEIAEVLYGLRAQSEAPQKKENDFATKFDPIRPSNESISRVSSPISNSAPTAPQNSSSSTVPFSVVAPKRKKPRQVSENISSISARNSQISSTAVKSEIDQQPKIETLLPSSSKNTTTGSENGTFQSLSLDFALSETPAKELPEPVRSPVKESPAIKPEDSQCDVAMTKVNLAISEIDIQREEKFEIDLMAPPPQLRSSPERGNDIDFAAVAEPKPVVSVAADAELRKMMVNQDKDVKAFKTGRDEMMVEEPELKKVKSAPVSAETEKALMIKERNIDLQLDLEKPDKDNTDSLLLSGNKSHPHVQKQQQPQLKVAKDEQPHMDKTAHSGSLPLPMTLASWPGGAPPMGYMAPLQGVVSMDGSQVPPTPVQPLFTQPRPKRCATHCYIARNIHYLQQFMKMNPPFWPTPAAAGPTSLFGGKPSNLTVIPPTELLDRSITSVQDKGQQGLAIFPGKEKASQPSSTMVDAQRKQQPPILLQQALPPGATPSNMMHGPAFIFPFNQHQTAAAVAAASVRPGPTKCLTTAPVSAATSASVNGSFAAAPTPAAVSFNYPNMPSNETHQYLAILQNNAYPFPIPAPAYRGTHPQPMPFFNGSFYTSQMIHPSQLQQQPPPQPHQQPHQQIQPGQPNTSISSGSSSSHKQHIQNQQQRPPQGNANLNTFPPPPKTRPAQSSQPHQARNIENETGHEDSPSTADSRSSRGQMSAYNQNFSMPIHHQNFALVSSTQALVGTSNGNNNTQGEIKKQQQSQPQGLKPGGETTFAMSFTPMNGGSNNTPGGSIDLSSVAQSHAVFQNLSEADRRNYQVMQAAAVAQAAQQRKNFRVAEEGKNGVNSLNIDEEKKGLSSKSSVTSGQSIAFTRPELTAPLVAPLTGTNVIDSSASARNLNSNNRGSRSSITNNSQLGQLQNMQFQQQHIQQQMVQIQKQQQQLQQQFTASRNNKSQPTSNGGVYSDHLSTSSPSSGSKFPNTISVFPQNNSPAQSPQWKNSTRAVPQAQSSSTSSMKNVPQQQQPRPQQSHTQISFGSGQKQQAGSCSPTTSLSKGGGGSPRAPSSNSQGNKASSLSSQQSKNASSVASLKTPSILGNPHNIASSNSNTKSQQQQQQQLQQMKQMANQQPQLFFSPAFMQTQPPQSTSNPSNTTSGYYLQRRYPEKQPQLQGGSPSGTSTGMLSLCTPVTQASSSTVEAKAGSASNSTKGPPGIPHHHPQFQPQSSGSYTYAHSVPAGVLVKPTTEKKQPAGSREPSTRK